jgi:hypothetical protein
MAVAPGGLRDNDIVNVGKLLVILFVLRWPDKVLTLSLTAITEMVTRLLGTSWDSGRRLALLLGLAPPPPREPLWEGGRAGGLL